MLTQVYFCKKRDGLVSNLRLSLNLLIVLGFLKIPAYAESTGEKPASSASPPSTAVGSCGAQASDQIENIKAYEKDKEASLAKFRQEAHKEEPARLLDIAEQSIQDYHQTGCESYLFEGVSLYQSYYSHWRKSSQGKVPIGYSIRNEYRTWGERAEQLLKAKGQEIPTFYKRPPEFFNSIQSLKEELSREQLHVEGLLHRRDRILIPSIAGLAVGVTLTLLGSVFQGLDGKPTGISNCNPNPVGTFCVYDFHKPAPAVMIGFGLALTIGGATGIVLSMDQAKQELTPASANPSSK